MINGDAKLHEITRSFKPEKVCEGHKDAVVEYQVGAWRMNSGTAHVFDTEGIRRIAQENFDRTPNILSTFNHTTLSGGEQWYDRLEAITAPTLIIHGTEDPVLPFAHALALKTAIADSVLLALQGSGHELHPQDWQMIIQALKDHTSEWDIAQP